MSPDQGLLLIFALRIFALQGLQVNMFIHLPRKTLLVTHKRDLFTIRRDHTKETHLHTQKRPIYTQKGPIYNPKRPTNRNLVSTRRVSRSVALQGLQICMCMHISPKIVPSHTKVCVRTKKTFLRTKETSLRTKEANIKKSQ